MAALRPLAVRYSRRAQSQLVAIAEYVTEESGPESARRVGQGIRDAIKVLSAFPLAGRPGRATGTREWVVRHLPYIIVYEIEPNGLEMIILGVFHCRQERP